MNFIFGVSYIKHLFFKRKAICKLFVLFLKMKVVLILLLVSIAIAVTNNNNNGFSGGSITNNNNNGFPGVTNNNNNAFPGSGSFTNNNGFPGSGSFTNNNGPGSFPGMSSNKRCLYGQITNNNNGVVDVICLREWTLYLWHYHFYDKLFYSVFYSARSPFKHE